MATEEQIKELAYFLWEQGGRSEGKDKEHWHLAKQILERQEAIQEQELRNNGLNIKAAIPKVSFALTLIALSLGSGKIDLMQTYILPAIIVLFGIVLVFENISPNPTWKNIVNSAKYLDITYVAFGLGLMEFSKTLFTTGPTVLGFIFLLFGLALAGWNIGLIIGSGGRMVLDQNVKVGIFLGIIMLVGGIVWFVLTWNTGTTIVDNLNDSQRQLVIVCAGIIFIFFGFKRRRDLQHLA